MTARQLFPQLPPEIRNLIYFYTVSEENPATSVGLTCHGKYYNSSHTEVTIMPIHHGNLNLLALRKYNFLEAPEYLSYLVSNAVELRIGMLFKGHTQTFIQEHWDQKMHAHLNKLMKKHRWIKKVSSYDIKIVWEPHAFTTSMTKNIGVIAKKMVDTLITPMDEDLKRKKGCVRGTFHVRDYVFAHCLFKLDETLRLRDFVSIPEAEFHTQFRQIRMISTLDQIVEERVLFRQYGIVQWGPTTEGHSLLRREACLGAGAKEKRSDYAVECVTLGTVKVASEVAGDSSKAA